MAESQDGSIGPPRRPASQPDRAGAAALRHTHPSLGRHGGEWFTFVIRWRLKPPHPVTPLIDSPTNLPQRVFAAARRDGASGGAGPAPGTCSGPRAHIPASDMATLEAQIADVLAGESGRLGAGVRSDLIRLRCKRLARMYRELALAGEQLHDIRQIGEHQATALLRRWRERHRSAATIRSDWSILRVWCAAIGKPGCIRTLREYWPEAPRAEANRDPASARRHGDSKLLQALARDTDRTHYFVERLCQVLRLSVQEALLFPVRDPSGAVKDSSTARKLQAAISAEPLEVNALLHDAAAFLVTQQRSALIWPGLELAQAMRRHENRLAYLRRKRAEAAEDL